MEFSKQSGGYTQQRSVQPLQAMAFQEENEEDPSQSTYSPHPTRYEVPNFVCPLGHQNRMQAREEEPPCRRPPNENPRDSDEYISQITKARIRGKTQLILEGLISIQDMQPVPDETSLEPAASQKTKPRSFVQRSCHILDLTREKQIEQIAHNNAQSDVEAWEDYLDRYTKGLINLLQPPPAWGAKFRFLSALHPPNEAQRMAVSAKYNTVLTQISASKRLGLLLKRCLQQFRVRYGSLSFFDNNYENFKLESGYYDKRINREISIAAHALYSSEVLVIPDTHLDWRFERNPLAARKPGIRFLAGAPLISADGDVFAVLSIFEKQPRNFTAQECELLAEYSAEMVNELDSIVEPSFRTTPLLERDSVIEGKYANRGINSPLSDFGTGRVESQFLPPPLNLRPKKPTSAGRDPEPTLSPSAESSNNLFDPLCPRAFTPGFYSTSSLTTVPLPSPRTSPLDYRNAADLAYQPDLNYVTKSMSPLDNDFAESERELWKENEDNLVDKCIRMHRMGAGPSQLSTPMDDSNMREDEAAVTELSDKTRQFYTPHHQQPLTRAQTEPFPAGPSQPLSSNTTGTEHSAPFPASLSQPLSSNRAGTGHSAPCPFPANEAQKAISSNQSTGQHSEGHFPRISHEAAQVHADQYPRALEQGPPIVQRKEKLRKFGKLAGIIGSGGYV